MIDFQEFFKFLNKQKKFIFIVPLLSMVLTFFLIRNLPEKFLSQSQISTGLADQSQQVGNQNIDFNRINQQFGNIIEMITMRKVLDRVSYALILHDLENSSAPFRPLSEIIKSLSSDQKARVIREYKDRRINYKSISLEDNGKLPLFDVIESMGYDQKDLIEDLAVHRNGESDFIEIAFESENPELSAFVVNTLSNEFIVYYTSVTSSNEKRTIALLDSVLKEKEHAMQEKNGQLKTYKSGQGVFNLGAQTEMLLKQISDYENQLSQTTRQIVSLRGAISRINGKLNSNTDSDLGAGQISGNNDLVNVENQLQIANQRYVQNNFRPQDKRIVDSLQTIRTRKIASSSNLYTTDPKANRQSLIAERMQLETTLSIAENSVSSINGELSSLRSRYNAMAPADANVQSLERDVEVSNKEYLDALNRYNEASVEKSTGVRLNIAEYGLPGLPQPSKRFLYLGLSGITSFLVIFAILLVIFMMDKSIKTAKHLVQATGIPLIGNINLITNSDKDLRHIWKDNDTIKEYSLYKDLLRSLRFDIDAMLNENNGKIIGITSLSKGDGKTFLSASLAYAFAMIGKKVLLIGDNNPDLASMISNSPTSENGNFENFLIKKEIMAEDLITILNRNPTNSSLLEVKDAQNLTIAFEILRKEFDIIIMDSYSLKQVNQVKEWLMFADMSVAIFQWGYKLTFQDYEFISYLKKHTDFSGWIFNKVIPEEIK